MTIPAVDSLSLILGGLESSGVQSVTIHQSRTQQAFAQTIVVDT